MAAVDYFLKIEGIEGESGDAKQKGALEIESFSWGETQTGTGGHGSGGGAGKVAMQDMHFTCKINKGSPKLMLACASGEHIKKAELTCRKAGKEQQEFLKITLSDILVSSYQVGGSGHGNVVPTDQFSMNFTKIEYELKPQNADGTLGAAVKAGWDLAKNQKV